VEMRRRIAGGRPTSQASCSRARRWSAARRPSRPARRGRARPRSAAPRGRPPRRAPRRPARRRAPPAARAPRPDLTRHDRELEVVVDRPEAAFAAWYEMFPRSQGRVPGRHGTFDDCIERLPDIRRMGFDVVYLPPIHPIGRTARKGPDNALAAGPGDPGSPLGYRLAGGRPHRGAPRPRHARGLPPAREERAGPGARDRPRLRDPVLARSPVGARAPRVVLPAAGRDDQVRGEPAQEVPGHLPDQLRDRGVGLPLGRAARGGPLLDRAGGADLPGRQPPHQAARLLGVADPPGTGARSGRDLPLRGLHPPQGHAGARRRLHAVLHYFTCATSRRS
jgi:hypothetical protein